MRAFRNSHLMGPEWLFPAVVSDDDYSGLLNPVNPPPPRPSAVRRALRRTKPWFWPRISDAGAWVESTESAGWNPYSYLRESPRPLLQNLLTSTSSQDMSVLDLGSNCGSDLDVLRRAGYTRLFGVDAGRDALPRSHSPGGSATPPSPTTACRACARPRPDAASSAGMSRRSRNPSRYP